MKNYITVCFLLCCAWLSAQDKNPLLADPTIFENEGTYYLYGTKGAKDVDGEGFQVYTSTDLKNWKKPAANNGFAFKKGDGYGTTGFWAPQVFKYNNKFYMAYTANEQIAIASSDSPAGPFKNDGKPLAADVRQIDPFIFFDNGKIYLYHVRLENGNRIFVAEMENDLSAIKPGTLKECITATKPWEDTEKVKWTVTEGPTVFKKDNLYYLLYSANDFRNKDYAVGCATSKSPHGPWEKPDSPFISQSLLKYPGTGHGDVFYDKKGSMYYVFHTHFSESEVAPRKTAIIPITLKGKQLSIAKGKNIIWLVL
ncbi:glycoside hydrolase family 43 protein [Flavobacterium subsaxonicum]|uniref:Beta-xylosidase n=1 Tax=Flavobacterium subsaxonicum WB 4.1-42 = DSM 21790 TaxID=1121898 RepID=A0A0A2MEY4_9FLAO|nr:glycoside hydrolase family 43 protein [Flavobacterium subsaxonicum]KGO91217.1 beta-xylosidase [Flavobacterium subsaxonicum WB 4.1-42 = DSM 21790]